MENTSHGLSNREVPHMERGPCGTFYIKREELLQTQRLVAETVHCLREDADLLLRKLYHGQYIIWDYDQGITTYGALSSSIQADMKKGLHHEY